MPTDQRAVDPALNPLCQKLGERVLRVRLARGLDVPGAAKQLGMPTGAYPLLEGGRLVPAPWLQERIKRWMWEGVSFEGHKHPQSYHAEAIQEGWYPLRVMLEPALRERLRNEAGRVGLTSEELVAIAVERLLNAPVVLSTLTAAQDVIRRTQMVELLKNYPDIRAILTGDMALACKVAGPEVKPAPARKIGAERLVEELEQKELQDDDAEEAEEEPFCEWDST